MHDPTLRWFGAMSFGSVCAAVVLACAGSETPQIDGDFEQAVADTYGNGSTGVSGTGGRPAGGSGGSAMVGAGGSSPGGRAGSSNAGGAAGSSASGGCDGFGILQDKCSGGQCHGAGTLNGNFAESQDIAAAFANQDPVTAACSMDGPVLNPDNPRGSLLIQKVNGTVPCGIAMPLAGALSAAEITCLEEWIGSL